MMMADDKKKQATLIIAKLRNGKDAMPEKAPVNEMGDEKDYGAGLDAAAEEMLQAVKTGDAQGLKEALKSFMELCDSESEEPEEETEAD